MVFTILQNVFEMVSGGFRGGSVEPLPLHPCGVQIISFSYVILRKSGQNGQIEPPSTNLNPLSKNPRSGPDGSQSYV